MKTNKFQCEPSGARMSGEGYWYVHLKVTTDNSQHLSTYRVDLKGLAKEAYGRYEYTPEQRHFATKVSESYHKACLASFEEFRGIHKLDAHGAKEIRVEFNKDAKITELREEFWDGD